MWHTLCKLLRFHEVHVWYYRLDLANHFGLCGCVEGFKAESEDSFFFWFLRRGEGPVRWLHIYVVSGRTVYLCCWLLFFCWCCCCRRYRSGRCRWHSDFGDVQSCLHKRKTLESANFSQPQIHRARQSPFIHSLSTEKPSLLLAVVLARRYHPRFC